MITEKKGHWKSAWLAFALAIVSLWMPSSSHAASTGFDHFTTGFELLGQHKDVPCASCHVGGIFKGTPHDCFSCHAAGSRIGATAKPAKHILSGNNCADCHTPFGWKPVAKFNHMNVLGSCTSCHNKVQSIGKPANHIPTTSECSSCHLVTLPWTAARFNHVGVTGNCASCHDNIHAPGQPKGHVPSQAACETCHSPSNFTTFAGAPMNHAGITQNCQSCHETGMSWVGVTMVDRPTAAQDPVHPRTGDCANCHSGFNPGDFLNTKTPVGHLPTTQPCTTCHTKLPDYSLYTMGATGHTGITGNCATCHGAGLSFLNMAPPALKEPPANHLPINGIACESCHSPSNFTSFAGTAMNHTGITTGCQSCHETGMTWFGVTMVDRPTPAQDPLHPTVAAGADCSQCHAGTNVGDFNKNAKPANHIPTTQPCAQCHTAMPDFSQYVMGATGHTGLGKNCAACHASNLSFANMAPPTLKEPPANHLPINGIACESCHSNTNFVTFAGTTMNHAGITTGCQNCHETGMSWTGVTNLVVRPTAAQDPIHPTSGDCASCHAGFGAGAFNTPTKVPPNHLPTTQPCANCHTAIPTWTTYVMGTQGHAGITSNCAACHAANLSFLNMAPPTLKEPPNNHLPINGIACESCHSTTNFTTFAGTAMNHAGITSGCQNCHETGMTWLGVTMVDRPTLAQDPAHPQSGDCADCHAGFNVGDFLKVKLPTGHLPTTQTCATCHTKLPDYSAYTMGATGHVGISSGCATCHAAGLSFLNIAPPALKEPPSNHLPINGIACESCHSNSNFTTFAGTAMNHAGITSGCQNCHESGMTWLGVTMVDRPTAAQDAAHPTTGDCATCHTGFNVGDFKNVKLPTGHLPTTQPCTTCHTKLPDYSQYVMGATGHTGISTGCATCHASGLSFLNIAPPALKEPPANHLPINGIACESCHSPTNFTVFSGTAMNHTGITSGCQACHETGMAWFGVTMVDRPTAAQDPQHPTKAAGPDCSTCHTGTNVGDFNKNAKPANHIPTTMACATCHTAIPTFSQYVMGATGHAGITSGCATCHASGLTFANMAPPTLKEPPSNHLPINGIACESCHSASNFTNFSGTAMNHAGITKNCQACHETGMSWFGVTMVDRPTPAQDASHPTAASANGADCSNCHSGFNVGDFGKNTKPANHIPTTAACSVCHTTPGDYTTYTTNMTTLHSAVATTCSTCHADGKGPFAGVATFKIVQMSTKGLHIPITRAGAAVECSGCHKTVTTFSGTLMTHAAIGDTGSSAAGNACDACHEFGFGSKFYGVTINWTRDSSNHYICGAPGTPTAPNITICNGGGSDCLTGCHQHQNQQGFSKYARVNPTTPRKQIQSAAPAPAPPPSTGPGITPPHRMTIGSLAASGGVAGRFDHTTVPGRACVTCHNGTAAAGRGPAHPATTGACADCHSTMGWRPVLRVDHADVIGACASCHNGVKAPGKTALHPLAGLDCDRCHTTSAWKPAAYDHANVLAGTCATCHNALQAPAKPAGHVATTLSCDTCHYVLGWSPVKPPVAAPAAIAPTKPTVKPTVKPIRPIPSPSVRPRGAGEKLPVQ